MWVVRWHDIDDVKTNKTRMLFAKDLKVAETIKAIIEAYFKDTSPNEKQHLTFVSISRIFVLGHQSFDTSTLYLCPMCKENSNNIKVRYESEIVYLWDDNVNRYEADEVNEKFDEMASIVCDTCGHGIFKQGELEYPIPETVKTGVSFKKDKLYFCTNCNTEAKEINLTVLTETLFQWDDRYKSYINCDSVDDNDNVISCTCSNCGTEIIKHDKGL
ncbi:MAG: hypothetical protein ABSG15_00800 [FCB group bacterium]